MDRTADRLDARTGAEVSEMAFFIAGELKWLDAVPYDHPGRLCHDCGVEHGEAHHEGCDAASCPNCGGQLLCCNCALLITHTAWGNTGAVLRQLRGMDPRRRGVQRGIRRVGARRRESHARRSGHRRARSSTRAGPDDGPGEPPGPSRRGPR